MRHWRWNLRVGVSKGAGQRRIRCHRLRKKSAIGGVWTPSRTYPGLHTNNARETYCFSDHPYPDTADPFPSAEQVREYLRSYAERFQIVSRIELNAEVLRVAKNSAGGLWQVTVRKAGHAHTHETLEFEFVVVCNGVFSKPRLPDLDGLDRFEGHVLHSSEFTNPKQVKAKRVVVIGAGKSAIDCASWAAREAASSTLLFRRMHWMLPRYILGLINAGWLFGARSMEFTMSYYKPRGAEAFLHRRARPLVRMLERGVLILLRLNLRMPPELTPDGVPLAQAFETSGVVSDFFRLVRNGSIEAKQGELQSATDGCSLKLSSGETLQADVVIFATGWSQEVGFLENSIRDRIRRDGRFHLYRMILPPDMRTLGFIGYNSSTVCQLTSEMAANWLSEVFLGRMRLPSVAEMDDDIGCMHRWLAQEMPGHCAGYFIGPFVSHYVDDLMRDMELSTTRTGNFITENLLPMWPSRYSTVAEERHNGGDARRTRRRFDLSGAYAAVAAGAMMLVLFWWLLYSSRFVR